VKGVPQTSRAARAAEASSAGPGSGECSAPAPLAVEPAVERIRGDRHLYHQLLVIFARTYTDAADRLRASLPERRAEAYRIVHSLKGAAATVGAEQVVVAAARLQTALGAGDPALEPQVTELELTLHAALRAISLLTASSPRG
jgi:two-component system sensor histidine kinase/response regulator